MFNMKNSQAWSLDIIFAVLIFIGAFFLFYFLLGSKTESSIASLNEEAEFISNELFSENSILNITDDGIINETKLQQLIGNYPSIKSKIRIDGDFCIYLEDQEGNIINIINNVTGIGSSKINISNVTCQ